MSGRKNILSDTDYAKGKDSRFKAAYLFGKVAEIVVNDKGANVRVIFPDRVDRNGQPLITKPIPVLQSAASGKRSFSVPRIGTDVAVAKLANSTSDYMLLGSFYTSRNPPPVTDPNLDYTEYDDGSKITFDAGSGTMTWDLKGGVVLGCEGGFTIQANGNVLIDAPNIKLQGAIELDGNITHTGNMVTSGHHTDASGVHKAP